MLIKHSALNATLQKGIQAVYIFIGSDEYLLNESCQSLKQHFRRRGESNAQSLLLNVQADWYQLINEANSFGLFAELNLIEASFNKKTLEKGCQKILEDYLNAANEQSLILIRAPQMTYKSISTIAKLSNLVVVQVNDLKPNEQLQWIKNQLKIKNIMIEDDIATEILSYTQGNLLASAQAIDRLSLLASPGISFKREDIGTQLIDQRDFEVQTLVDNCLNGDADKALRILEQAKNGRGEHVLILWLLMQALRQLLTLSHSSTAHIPFSKRCSSLSIWPNREGLFQKALQRLNKQQISSLLQYCHQLDLDIKTSQANIWTNLSALALSICIGKELNRGL